MSQTGAVASPLWLYPDTGEFRSAKVLSELVVKIDGWTVRFRLTVAQTPRYAAGEMRFLIAQSPLLNQ